MKNTFFIFILIFILPLKGPAQQVLQLERAHRARTVKMPVGTPLTFRLRNPEAEWERGAITDLDVAGQRVKLDLLWYKISDIEALKRQKSGGERGLGAMLGVFGISWAGYSAIGQFLYNDDEINWNTAAIIAATTLPTAWWLTRPRTLKMGKKHRLRVLDLTYPPAAGDSGR
ncbi:MAG: hypothetical protein ACR2K1_08435 [Saprospiraceae bacterium]